jgi:hypothetical protein
MTINKVSLNGNTGGASIAQELISALNDERIVREIAGFLIKASFDEDHLMLAVEPALINGERTMHYNMHLEIENQFTLIGGLNAQGVFTILFKPDNMEQFAAESPRFIEVCRRLAGFLLENGYAGEGRLDEVTQRLLNEAGLSPAPQGLADLCSQSSRPALEDE